VFFRFGLMFAVAARLCRGGRKSLTDPGVGFCSFLSGDCQKCSSWLGARF
jgi:hypothetical protein